MGSDIIMNAKESVAKRIAELCAQRDTTVNHLANLCGIPPTTIYSMLGSKSQNPGIVSIQKNLRWPRYQPKGVFQFPSV